MKKNNSSKKATGRSLNKSVSNDFSLNTSVLDVLLKNSFEVIALISEDGVVKYVSSSVKEIAGYEAEELIGEDVFNYVHPKDQEAMGYLFQNLDALHTDILPVFQFLRKDGNYKFVEIQLNNQLETPGIGAIVVNMRDITDSKSAREQLIISEKRLKRAQKISRVGNWEVDLITEENSWSDELYRILGYKPGEVEPSLENYLKRMHPDDVERALNTIKESKIDHKSLSFTHRVVRDDGEIRVVKNERRFQFDENNQAVGVYGVLHDITKQVKAEEALRENALNLEEAFHIALIGTWGYDIVNNRYQWSKSSIEVIGFKEEDIPQTWEEYREFFHPEDKDTIYQESKKVDQAGGIDIEHRLLVYGELKWVRVKSNVQYDHGGTPQRVIGIIQDITNIKRNETQLQKALEEKTALLAEVHHRVKNNLAIVSGLLELQRMESENEEIDFAFTQSINRISSIAMVHELIYQSDELSSVDIQSYLDNLIPQIKDTMASEQKEVDINLDLENYQISITQAIPVGLLLNELLTNSFKYAFRGRETGSIKISVRHYPDNNLKVVYEDDGNGFGANTDFENPVNLGLTLVHSQLNQLEASYKVDTRDRFRIEFMFNGKIEETGFHRSEETG